jgi:hypothetical protein
MRARMHLRATMTIETPIISEIPLVFLCQGPEHALHRIAAH